MFVTRPTLRRSLNHFSMNFRSSGVRSWAGEEICRRDSNKEPSLYIHTLSKEVWKINMNQTHLYQCSQLCILGFQFLDPEAEVSDSGIQVMEILLYFLQHLRDKDMTWSGTGREVCFKKYNKLVCAKTGDGYMVSMFASFHFGLNLLDFLHVYELHEKKKRDTRTANNRERKWETSTDDFREKMFLFHLKLLLEQQQLIV